MGESTKIIEEIIKKSFPLLKDDPNFKVTSPFNPAYNCIAWAYNYNDRWMWPDRQKVLDGIYYWPDESTLTPDVESFISAFRLKGYEVCSDDSFEEGFRKIALYVKKGTTECTHAARQLTNGFWTSKLGAHQDIQHCSPKTLEGDEYGTVYCIMKRPFS